MRTNAPRFKVHPAMNLLRGDTLRAFQYLARFNGYAPSESVMWTNITRQSDMRSGRSMPRTAVLFTSTERNLHIFSTSKSRSSRDERVTLQLIVQKQWRCDKTLCRKMRGYVFRLRQISLTMS